MDQNQSTGVSTKLPVSYMNGPGWYLMQRRGKMILNWRRGPKENKSASPTPGKHKYNMDFYFQSLVQFQANVFFTLYIRNSGNKVGKVNVIDTSLKTMKSASLPSHLNNSPDIHPSQAATEHTAKVLGCQIFGSTWAYVTSPHFTYTWLSNTEITSLWNFPSTELYFS